MNLITTELVDDCGGWMRSCSECGAETDAQVELGAPYADEPGGWFCQRCLLKALALISTPPEMDDRTKARLCVDFLREQLVRDQEAARAEMAGEEPENG